MRQVLKTGNTRKAAGPDGVLGKVLCACADQLVGVLTRLFNLSLSQATITPVPKTAALKCLSDYRPIALTSVVTKML